MIYIDSLAALAKEAEKVLGIHQSALIGLVQQGAVRAYKSSAVGRENEDVHANWNPINSHLDVMIQRKIVELVKDPAKELSIKEAAKRGLTSNVGELVTEPIDSSVYDSIAVACSLLLKEIAHGIAIKHNGVAQSAFADLHGKCVAGVITEIKEKCVVVESNGISVLLPESEQISTDKYQSGLDLVVFVKELREGSLGHEIVASRSSRELVSWSFRKHVAEIVVGAIEIKAISRLPGKCSRVAVASKWQNTVERCEGKDRKLLATICKTLGGEEVQVVTWSTNAEEFLRNALKTPVTEVHLFEGQRKAKIGFDTEAKTNMGKDFNDDLSLAEELTGWKIEEI